MTQFVRMILAIAIVLAAGCKTDGKRGSEVEDLAADPNAKNIFVLMGARIIHEGEEAGYLKAIPEVRSTFEELALNRGFQVQEFYKLTKAEILQKTEEAARAVGENGTLIWYVSSHGMGGLLRSYDKDTVLPKEIVEALRKGRTFDGKVKPLGRLYMFFDFCNSTVTAKKINDDVKSDLVDLSKLHNESNPMATALAAVGPQENSEGLGLTGHAPLFREALLFAPTGANQVAYGATFLDALVVSLKHFKGSADTTIADFFNQVATEIAKTKIETTLPDGTKKNLPQSAGVFAIPDNSFMQEPLFASAAKEYGKNSEPCPPWEKREWNYTHGRDVNGKCLNPEKLCFCTFELNETHDGGNCVLKAPRKWRSRKTIGVGNTFDAGTTSRCYRSCESLAKANKEAMLEQCSGNLMMVNPIKRLELWNYESLLQ